MGEYLSKVNDVINEVRKVVIGKDEIIEMIMTAIIAKGHILLEDIPGVGKTTMALAFSKSMDLDVKRMQFTSDVLPSDVVGFTFINQMGNFEYKKGAVMCNLFLADEINRTSPKTQSALLEVMEEGKVSVDGVTRKLEKPFIVIATQNPTGSAGTQFLPESQLDRFMIKLSIGYPDLNSEAFMLKTKQNEDNLLKINGIITKQELLSIQDEARRIYTHDSVLKYIAEISLKSRENEYVKLGQSPRGSIALVSMAKARAYISGRNYVIPEDVRFVLKPVMQHRIILNSKARINKVTIDDVIDDILRSVVSPEVFK